MEDFPEGLLCHQQDVACFPEAQPQDLKDGEEWLRGRQETPSALVTQAGPSSSWPQFPHLYNGYQWGQVMLGSEDSHCPESQTILATPNATHRQLCPQQAKHTPQAPPSAHCADGTRCSNLVVLGVGVAGPSGLAGKPWVWPRDL